MHRRIIMSAIVLVSSSAALAQDSELKPPAEDVFQQMVAWSPDGTRLLYSQFAGGEFTMDKWSLHVVELESGVVVWLVQTTETDLKPLLTGFRLYGCDDAVLIRLEHGITRCVFGLTRLRLGCLKGGPRGVGFELALIDE